MTVSSLGPTRLVLWKLRDPATQQGLFKAPGLWGAGGWGQSLVALSAAPHPVLATEGQEEEQLCPWGLGAWNPKACPWSLVQFSLKEITPWVSLWCGVRHLSRLSGSFEENVLNICSKELCSCKSESMAGETWTLISSLSLQRWWLQIVNRR